VNIRSITTVRIAIGFSCSVFAHHSTRGIYKDEEIVVTGKVKEWRFINPHPYFTLEVIEDNGDVHEWDVSYGGAAVVHLKRQGYTETTFSVGEEITVTGNPARAQGVYGILIEGGHMPKRADGSDVVVGGSMF
jgi:hypothetical protein